MVYRTSSLGLNKITLLYLAPRILLTHCTPLLSVYLHTVSIFIPAHFILFSMQIIVVVRSVYTITCFVFLSLQSIADFSAGFSVSGLQGLSDKRLFNPHSLQPSRCIKEYFWISAEWLNFLHLGVLELTFSWNCFDNNNICVSFATPLTLSGLNLSLSSSSTTSRELLSQFSTCSRWRWFDGG